MLVRPIIATTEIGFLPDWVGAAWRSINFIVCAVLMTIWFTNLLDYVRGVYVVPLYSLWGQMALLFFAAKVVVTQVELWNAPLVLEGPPWNSLILFCAVMNLYYLRRR